MRKNIATPLFKKKLDGDVRAVYLNCEDFKRHSFPNVLIEILDSLFQELENHLSGWFGRKRRSKELITQIRNDLNKLKSREDLVNKQVRELNKNRSNSSQDSSIALKTPPLAVRSNAGSENSTTSELETHYDISENKISELDSLLPNLKQKIRKLFELSSSVKAIFLQLDQLLLINHTEEVTMLLL